MTTADHSAGTSGPDAAIDAIDEQLGIGSSAPAAVPPSVAARRRRRRPTGAAPPLPRSIGATGKGWLIALAVVVGWSVVVLSIAWAERAAEEWDTAILRAITHVRTAWLTDVMKGIDRVLSGWATSIVAYALMAALIVLRRWRHLFT